MLNKFPPVQGSIYSRLPKITGAKISFLRIFTLPDLVEKSDKLRSDYKFLSSSTDYSTYYLDYERPYASQDKRFGLAKIPELGFLRPLSKRHTLNSFWKSYRLKYEREKEIHPGALDLFLLLPLKIDISIGHIRANNLEFPGKLFVYLFPFGACAVNLEIDTTGKSFSFDQFIDLIQTLQNASNVKDGNNFQEYAKILARKINDELFGPGSRILSVLPTHCVVFVEQTSERLYLDKGVPLLAEQMAGIAALLSGNKDIPVTSEIDKILKVKIKEKNPEEILLFYQKRTLLYPSKRWREQKRLLILEKLEKTEGKSLPNSYTLEKVNQRLKKSLDCMCENYRSFLNVTFATNRVLWDYVIPNKSQISNEKRQALSALFSRVFPTKDGVQVNQFYYYLHALEAVGTAIGLHDAIEKVKK